MSGAARGGTAAATSQAVPGGAQLVGATDSGLFVGVVTERNRAAAYVSDGSRLGLWLTGGVKSGTATLSDGAGSTLSLRLSTGAATGRLQLAAGSSSRVDVSAAVGTAGLFARARRVVVDGRVAAEDAGWVRLRDGRVRGVRQIANPGGKSTVVASPSILKGSVRITPDALLRRCVTARQAVPGCGLSLDARPALPTTRRVIANPKAAGFTSEELQVVADKSRARVRSHLQKAGLRFLTDADRRLADGWAAKLRASTKVKQASGSLLQALLSGNLDNVSRRQGEFEETASLLGLTMPDTVRARADAMRRGVSPPLLAPPKPVGAPSSTIVLSRDDFALTEERSSHGDATFPSVSAHLQATPSPDSLVLVSRVSAGFNAEGNILQTLVGRFDVPAGVEQVEIELDGRSQVDQTENNWCVLFPPVQFGFGGGSAFLLVNAERLTSDGGSVIVDGFHESTPPDPAAQGCLPVPDPPPLVASWPRFIRFAPSAAGGSYQLSFHAHAWAYTLGLATADADVYLELERATIRFRR